LGVLKRAGSWLDDRVANNWVKDTYEWDKEVVVVTGGSDGIGKEVVLLLAERGVRVAVLDVQGLTYEGMCGGFLSRMGGLRRSMSLVDVYLWGVARSKTT
jgi:hypothetical protein